MKVSESQRWSSQKPQSPPVRFGIPSTMYTTRVNAIRMCRGEALTIYVVNALGAPKNMHGNHDPSQLEIRILPDGQVEIFHDDHMIVNKRPFSEYYTPTYADFGF